MPNVGGKKFPYTATGQTQARRYARESGQPMSRSGNTGYNRAPFPTRESRVPGVRRPGPGMVPRRPGARGGNMGRPNQPRRPAISVPRGPGRGGSRVMGNPGLSGRARKNPGVGPGRVQRPKSRTGRGY
jgi:hypothetical protein